MLATYIHNMDPVILDVIGPIKLRWYGLGYLLGFVLGYLMLRWLARKKLWVLPESKVGDFIAYAAFFGVFLGGRLGYILFYQIPKKGGFQELLGDPLMIFRVWDGGMASHGGILGLVVFTYFYAKKNKVSWTGVGDGLCVVAPIGIGLVRIANFINGELYGRIDRTASWAMKFPSSLSEDIAHKNQEIEGVYHALNAADPSIGNDINMAVAKARENKELEKVFDHYLEPRHPSQLYEAVLEGLVLFFILLFMRLRFPKLPHGIITGLFFVFYAGFRIFVENYRQPDLGQNPIMGLTKGQFYSTFMIIGGLCFIGYALARNGKTISRKE